MVDAAYIAATVARALGMPEDASGTGRLAARLKKKTTLLVLDNCEHFIADVAQLVHALLRECPSLTILTTSREPFGLLGEAAYRLESLAVPEQRIPSLDVAMACAATALFMERARSSDVRYEFNSDRVEVMVQICRAVDGIPLAIEMAVGHLPTLGIRAILSG